ncbi:oligodendrocyte-myelin glycoprotein-like [Anarrhichthys ocellatus]|uniref:oligodendrocyte-myelin glycoprotein-like n=1 Tax=Anarrhichthys ocellatus TaxID=433405 RepID=UPI0012ED69E5|nr:oligodendrocyte-myelin glycoprotein-like [Anarrhichthys ocellatus]XP_031694183.1 oligodendrocyte-myelin glycoprotein-like [Anarrhichthys ocellatus]
MTACLFLLLCGLLGGRVVSICPTVCSCSRGHRAVDCSSRGLTKLPPGLQHNINFLNLSFNSLQGLESQLTHYAHLRTLDLSYNRLETLPPALPRSLWDIRAAGNHLRSLDKNDTAYHWNLKVLDLSGNELERVVFINNTLPSLRTLDLSHNRFWTVPTNMPHNLERADLSHNYLAQILPGSLDRLLRLAQFYLHANRFSWLPEGIFDKLAALEVMTLGDNPWACEEEENITKLLTWAGQTRATVLGCPCYTKPICGQQAAPGRERHSAPFTEPPLWVDEGRAGPSTGYQAKWALFETGEYEDRRGANGSGDHVAFVWTSPTNSDGFSPHTSTTARTSSTKKPRAATSRNKSHGLFTETRQAVSLTILVLTAFNTF